MTEEQNLKQISKVMPDPCIEVKICYYHIQDFSDILPYPCGLVKQCDLALKNLAVWVGMCPGPAGFSTNWTFAAQVKTNKHNCLFATSLNFE